VKWKLGSADLSSILLVLVVVVLGCSLQGTGEPFANAFSVQSLEFDATPLPQKRPRRRTTTTRTMRRM
jgi:hypothetical protein